MASALKHYFMFLFPQMLHDCWVIQAFSLLISDANIPTWRKGQANHKRYSLEIKNTMKGEQIIWLFFLSNTHCNGEALQERLAVSQEHFEAKFVDKVQIGRFGAGDNKLGQGAP